MKKTNLLFVFLCLSYFTYGQCDTDDCKSIPITKGCERHCNSLTTIITEATESELKLIAGLDSVTIAEIFSYRQNTEKSEAFEFASKLTEDQKNEFTKDISSLNETQTCYFNLSENDRKRVIKQFEKIDL